MLAKISRDDYHSKKEINSDRPKQYNSQYSNIQGDDSNETKDNLREDRHADGKSTGLSPTGPPAGRRRERASKEDMNTSVASSSAAVVANHGYEESQGKQQHNTNHHNNNHNNNNHHHPTHHNNNHHQQHHHQQQQSQQQQQLHHLPKQMSLKSQSSSEYAEKKTTHRGSRENIEKDEKTSVKGTGVGKRDRKQRSTLDNDEPYHESHEITHR